MSLFLALLLAADLSGSWVLDRDASESMDAVLTETQDLSWLERQVMNTVDVTHQVQQDGDAVHVEVQSKVYTRASTHVTDKQWRDSELRTGPATQRAWWEGEVLVVETKGTIADGTAALYRTERWVEGDDMFLVFSISTEDGRSWKVKRVLRRA